MEASLTGESTPVGKNCEQENMIFLGTRTVKGHGVAIVTATGMNTEFGKIAGLIENQTNGPTPLQTKLNNLSKILAILVIILCAFNFGFGI